MALTRFFASVLTWKIDFRRIPQAAAQGTGQKGRGVSRALTWSLLRQVGDLGEVRLRSGTRRRHRRKEKGQGGRVVKTQAICI